MWVLYISVKGTKGNGGSRDGRAWGTKVGVVRTREEIMEGKSDKEEG